MDAIDTVEASPLLGQLTPERWSPETFTEWHTKDFAEIGVRQELARELQAKLALGEADPFSCGAAAFLLGRFDAARELLARAGDSDAASCLLALSLTALARGEEALPLLRRCLKKHAGAKELRVAEIEALAQSGEVEEAETRRKAFVKDFKRDLDGICLRGLIEERSGDPETAIDTYRSVLEKDPHHARTLFRLAWLLDLHGEDDEAIRLYERLRETQPTYPNAVLNLGLLYEDREEYEKAARCFQWVLKTDPYNERARLFLRDAEASLNMYYDEEQERLEDKFNQILRTPITDFELSVRSRNCLSKMQIETLGDLVQKTEAELLSYKNFGETSLAEIKDILASKGLHLGMSLGKDEEARLAREKAISVIFGPQMMAHPRPGVPLGHGAPERSAPEPPEGVSPEVFSKPVGDISFSMRIKRALAILNVNTLGDLAQRTEQEFLSIKNFGQTSLDELKKRAAEHGITLRKS